MVGTQAVRSRTGPDGTGTGIVVVVNRLAVTGSLMAEIHCPEEPYVNSTCTVLREVRGGNPSSYPSGITLVAGESIG